MIIIAKLGGYLDRKCDGVPGFESMWRGYARFGDMVEIIIADTGHGVSQEAKEKLFLPYFSTKKRGTGLGLAIVGRIIEDHHGSVRVEENSPLGARFIVELPVVVGAPSPIAGKVEQPDHA